MMSIKRLITFSFIALLFLPSISFSEVADHIVVNEIQISGATTKDEFVRLYNPFGYDVSLSGWRLSKITTSGKVYSLVTSFPELTIKSGGFVTISHAEFSGEKDIQYSTTSSIAADNAIVLYSDNGKTAVDKVAFGENVYGEGGTIANPSSLVRAIRAKDGWDTDNNAVDFRLGADEEDIPEEGEGNSSSSKIENVYINEVMPNPASPASDSSDEWIEFRNDSNERVNLSGATIRDGVGSVHEYAIPEGTFVEAGRYAIFYSSATRISLNNSGDFVELLGREGTLVDSTGDSYGEAKDGLSYAFDGGGWRWTKSPTPLGENVMSTEESEEEREVAAVASKSKKGKQKEAKDKKVEQKKDKKIAKGVKGSSKSRNVGSLVEGDGDEDEEDAKVLNNKTFGISLIVIAGLIGINYIVFREKIYEILKQKN